MAFDPTDPFFETTISNLIDQRISQSQLSSLVRQLQGGATLLSAYQAGTGTRNAFSWGDLTSGAGPAITLPYAGDYEITFGAYFAPLGGSYSGEMGVTQGATSSSSPLDTITYANGAGSPASEQQKTRVLVGLAAGPLRTQFYGTCNFSALRLLARPVPSG